jgi:hypothetical protein
MVDPLSIAASELDVSRAALLDNSISTLATPELQPESEQVSAHVQVLRDRIEGLSM